VNALRTGIQNNKRIDRGRLSALLVIVSFVLPFVQLAFGLTEPAEATLPACCRAHGNHRCAMRMSVRSPAEPSSPQLAQVTEKCPCPPGLAPAAHGNTSWDFTPGFGEFHKREEVGVADADYGRECFSSPEFGNRKRGPPVSSKNA
jgi:hypothetical protein